MTANTSTSKLLLTYELTYITISFMAKNMLSLYHSKVVTIGNVKIFYSLKIDMTKMVMQNVV